MKKLKVGLLIIISLAIVANFSSCTLTSSEPVMASEVTIENTEIVRGEEMIVSVKVTNTGGSIGDQIIYLDFGDNEGVDYEQFSVRPEMSLTKELSYVVPDNHPLGEVDVTVRSEDDSDTVVVEVIDSPAFYEIEIQEIQSRIPVGQTLEVVAEVTNTGAEVGKIA